MEIKYNGIKDGQKKRTEAGGDGRRRSMREHLPPSSPDPCPPAASGGGT